MNTKAVIGAVIPLMLILFFQKTLVEVARQRARREKSQRTIHFMDLLISCEDESYSLSRVQMYLWTIAIIMGYWSIYAVTGKFPDIKENLYLLMGVNFATSVASMAINSSKTPPTQEAATAAIAAATTPADAAAAITALTAATAADARRATPANFIQDLFFEVKDGKIQASLDLPRTQMFIWTIISLSTFAIQLVGSFSETPELPDIKNGLVALMGISNGAYLGAKAAKK